jgi:hypothetical protein
MVNADVKNMPTCDCVSAMAQTIRQRVKKEEWLERIAQDLYGWTFDRVQSHWIARLGKVEGFWDKIRLRKVESYGRD